MTTYKKTAHYLSVLCLFASVNAGAADAICNNAHSAIRKLTDKDYLHDTMMGVKPTYEAQVADGFLYGNEAGLLFKKNKIVSWGAGDLLVIHPQESEEQKKNSQKNPLKFFVQYDKAPYNGQNDKGTQGGIYKVNPQADKSDSSGVTCSKEASDYAYHFFPSGGEAPAVGDVYCVRTRSGKGYALIKVTNICESGLVFAYKYNGASNEFAGEKETTLSQQKGRTTPQGRSSERGSYKGKS